MTFKGILNDIIMILHVFDARKPIFEGFMKFRFSVTVNWPFLIKIGREGTFPSFTHIFHSTLLQSMQDQSYKLFLPSQEVWIL